MPSISIIKVGSNFGLWEVLDPYAGSDSNNQRLVRCRCWCGTEKLVLGSSLVRPNPSLGCKPCRNTGEVSPNLDIMPDPLVRKKWRNCHANMLLRVLDKTDEAYPNYGGRGIRVCKSWRVSQRKFLEWIITQPGYQNLKMTLDRKDNDWHYCPANCRLVTMKHQMRNRRNNIIVNWDGESMTATDFWERYVPGFTQGTVIENCRKGVPPQEIIRKSKLKQRKGNNGIPGPP